MNGRQVTWLYSRDISEVFWPYLIVPRIYPAWLLFFRRPGSYCCWAGSLCQFTSNQGWVNKLFENASEKRDINVKGVTLIGLHLVNFPASELQGKRDVYLQVTGGWQKNIFCSHYQLLPTTSVGNEWGQQMRIQILIWGFKGLKRWGHIKGTYFPWAWVLTNVRLANLLPS